MKISVKVKAGAKDEKIAKIDDSHFVVAVKEPPFEGRANEAVARALADYFGVARMRVKILRGFSGRKKVVEINL